MTVIFEDNFDSYTDGASYLPRTGWSGSSWTVYKPAADGIIYPTSGGGDLIWAGLGSDVEIEATLRPANSSTLGGLVACWADSNNFLLLEVVYFGGENALKLYRRQSGTYTELDTHTAAGFAVDVFSDIRLRVDGLNVDGWLNDTLVVSATLANTTGLGTGAGLWAENGFPNFGYMRGSTLDAEPTPLVVPTAIVVASALPSTLTTGSARATVRGHATTNGTNGTSVVVNVPTHEIGDLLLALDSQDNPSTTPVTTASTGWVRIYHDTQGSNVLRLSGFAKIATGSDALTITAANQDYAIDCLAIANHGVTTLATDIKVAASASATTGNADPPSLDAGSARDWLEIAHCAIDMTATGDTLSAVPTNYTELARLKSASSTSSVAIGSAWRQVSTQTENPGTFTNTSRPWIATTLAIPPLDTSVTLIVPVAVASAAAVALALAGTDSAAVATPSAATLAAALAPTLVGVGSAAVATPTAQLVAAAVPITLTALAPTVELLIPTAAAALVARPLALTGAGAAALVMPTSAASVAARTLALSGSGATALSLPPATSGALVVPLTLFGAGTASLSVSAAILSAAARPLQLDVGLGSSVELQLPTALVTLIGLALDLDGAGVAPLVLPAASVSAPAVPAALTASGAAQLSLVSATATLSARPLQLAGTGDVELLVPIAVISVLGVVLVLAVRSPTFPVGVISGSVEHARITGSVEHAQIRE